VPGYVGDTRTLDVRVKWLRSKIAAETANPVHLVTVRVLGPVNQLIHQHNCLRAIVLSAGVSRYSVA